jgi:hypothetical protein
VSGDGTREGQGIDWGPVYAGQPRIMVSGTRIA